MTVASYWASAELRRRWRPWLAIAVLVGVGFGLSAASLAAAWRTDSAYPRFLEMADSPDLVLDPDFEADGPSFLDAVEDLPYVLDRSDVRTLGLGEIRDGAIAVDSIGSAVASVGDDRFYRRDRVHVIEGRMPDPDRRDEVLVSHTEAADGVSVGERIPFGVLGAETIFGALDGAGGAIPADDALSRIEVEVVGVGVFPELAVVDEEYALDVVLITPALEETIPERAHLWTRSGIYLAPGTDVRSAQRDIKALAQDVGGDVFFENRAEIRDQVQRSVRPYVLALVGLGFAGVTFVALLGSQLVQRTVAQTQAERRVLVALSADQRLVRWCAGLPLGVVAFVALVVAVSVQATVSHWTPVGPVALVETDPGIALDPWVVGGTLVAVWAVCASGVVWLRGRGGRSTDTRPSLAGRAAQLGAPLVMSLGIARATGPGHRADRTVTRSGLTAVVTSAAMLVAVVTVALSLGNLVANPEVHGWNADVALIGAEGYGDLDVDAAAAVPGVEELSATAFGNVNIGETSVPGIGVAPLRGDLVPPIVEGRAPSVAHEIALGRRSMAQARASLGDVVEVTLPEGEPSPMTIVGIAVLPGLGPIDNDRPTLGEGAMVVLSPDDVGTWPGLMAELSPNADRQDVIRDLVTAVAEPSADVSVFELYRPVEIGAFARLGSVPLVLAALLSAMALGSLLHVLLVTSRTWRHERGVLAALGATPAQLRGVVRWHAVTVVGIALLLGVPLGVTLGRWAWRSLAVQIGIDPTPHLAHLAVLALCGGLLAVALAASQLSEARSARHLPVAHLRSE